ncbi:MAG TPA: class I SAM-dependent methyltransferase [Humibacillus xanthopallidus]|nr:class I SAM-dependent methyltransferase [Humibacillus xanthopallidus]
MTQTAMSHWARELHDFEQHCDGAQDRDYRSWQPTKWQSLESLRDRLVTECWNGRPGPDATALELGCGSATLLIQLQERGVHGIGVDRDPGARQLARAAAGSLGVAAPALVDADFFDPGALVDLPMADLVFHIGVIEHFGEEEQLEFLRISASRSHRWVLIGIPNENGPVFSGFLKAVTAADAVYDHDHQHIDVPALVQRAGYRLARADGLHLFYSTPDLYTPGDPSLDALHDLLRERLVEVGGERYAAFPHLAFEVGDIPVLRRVEESLTSQQRYDAAFLRYYLIDIRPDLGEAVAP